MILFVDDMPERFERFLATRPNTEAVLCQTADEACQRILQLNPTEIWLDHDASFVPCNNINHPEPCYNTTLTFRSVACMLAAMKYVGVVHCHSGNKDGRGWMVNLLRDHGVKVKDECLGFAAGD